jgi:thiol-disulfide isomerase/thioredoxin
MKKIVLILLLISPDIRAFAQFHLSGQVLNSANADTITLNIPFVYGYYPEHDRLIPVNREGRFSCNLSIKEQKFARLSYKGKQYLLMLSPGKNLAISLNAADTTINKFTGTGAEENKLLYNLDLRQIPFFRKPQKGSQFVELSPDALQEQVVKPWFATRDKQLNIVSRTFGISKNDQRLISQEVKSNAITQLSYFARNDARMKRDALVTFLLSLYRDISTKADVFPAGQMYYEFADSYAGYLEAASFNDFQQNGSDPKRPLMYYGMSLDSSQVLVGQKGKMYMNWLAIKNKFEPEVAEAMLAQAIDAKCQDKELSEVRPLMQDFKVLYPNSRYMDTLSVKESHLEALLAANKGNKEIKIIDDYKQITSIYEVINRYKGKVIYLDVWGTWCAPCRYELGFSTALKQHFLEKDVLFIYLDMDDDAKDGNWREFLSLTNLSGLHLRKGNSDIRKIWEELQPLKDKREMYPSYFIFDRSGKLVKETAKRPSEGIELYKQIEKYL